jgi:hypothetical protein
MILAVYDALLVQTIRRRAYAAHVFLAILSVRLDVHTRKGRSAKS